MTVYCPWEFGISFISFEGIVIKPDAEFWNMSSEDRESILQYARYLCQYCDDLERLDHSNFYTDNQIIDNDATDDRYDLLIAFERLPKNVLLGQDELYRYQERYKKLRELIEEREYKHNTRRSPLPKLRQEVIDRDNSQCRYCGQILDIDDIHIDHIHPYSRGGETVFENLVVSCPACNISKHARTPEEAGMRLIENED